MMKRQYTLARAQIQARHVYSIRQGNWSTTRMQCSATITTAVPDGQRIAQQTQQITKS
jgi:hypothetical protein